MGSWSRLHWPTGSQVLKGQYQRGLICPFHRPFQKCPLSSWCSSQPNIADPFKTMSVPPWFTYGQCIWWSSSPNFDPFSGLFNGPTIPSSLMQYVHTEQSKFWRTLNLGSVWVLLVVILSASAHNESLPTSQASFIDPELALDLTSRVSRIQFPLIQSPI